MTTQVSSLILDALVARLAADLADAVLEEETVETVKGGRLQDDPTDALNGISVTVHIGDPDDDGWRDINVAFEERSMSRRFVDVPAFEVGGGSFWWRRGVVRWTLFDQTGSSQDDVRERALGLQGRIERAVAQTEVGGLEDDLGEAAIMLQHVWSRPAEAGGPPDSYIWRGAVAWQVLTARPY